MTDRHRRLIELAKLFTKLGFTAFGGPAVHAGMMEEEVVHRRGWIDRQHFLDLLSAVNFIPGPNSTELAIHIGLERAGFAGLIVAGVCFITPAVLIILPLAWLYTTYGQMPSVNGVLHGIGAVVIAVIAVAMIRLARAALAPPLLIGIAIFTLVAAVLLRHVTAFPVELLLLMIAAIAGAMGDYLRRNIHPRLPVVAIVPIGVGASGVAPHLTAMVLAFLRIGATLFGSGYLLVPYLQSGLVDRLHLLSQQQMQDSIAIGQITPGPLLTTATFAGYVIGHTKLGGGHSLGILAGVLATVAIFAPSFVFVALLGRFLPALRRMPPARGALDGMNAAVVVMIFLVLVKLASTSLTNAWSIGIAVVGCVMMLVWNINSTLLIIGAAAIGWIVFR